MPTCHIVPQGMPGFNSNLTCPGGVSTAGDATRAKQLFQQGLQEEGMTLATFPAVTITYASGSTARDNQITTARQMWKTALGIDVKSSAIDFNQLVTQVTNSTNNPKGLQMWAIGWIAALILVSTWIWTARVQKHQRRLTLTTLPSQPASKDVQIHGEVEP